MKTIGLIGGMSWESTAAYYRIINEEVKSRLGGLHSAKCVLYSVDFAEIQRYQAEGNWDKAGQYLGEVAYSLEQAGADFIVICTNTMHKVIEAMEARVRIPILHIADATYKQISKTNIRTVGLLGTKYTMEQTFYKSRLESSGLSVIIPNEAERDIVNHIIFKELCLGDIRPASREAYQGVIKSLIDQGAEAIILGCTEIGLLIGEDDSEVPLFDTTVIHAIQAVDHALD
ncbi:aspartate/glutamate racemase family protein [Paenibacillus paeoniae]|uniref:Aspartate/glutamate racemase family protein n=1 Tax=Paenibacillus paeoniae TaxID=2292705 RepID=A0A371PJ19_9BACL|nr:aspartate/glutamate racemase family protein [Paenibacillus paeoniae]REK76210.1 aspartate/glutamate racemase family protein [Paenibacillus paeoniae]